MTIESSTVTLVSTSIPVLTSAIGIIGIIFGGAGYWGYRSKKAEIDAARVASKDRDEFKEILLEQIKELLKRVDSLNDTKNELLREIYSLRAQLNAAGDEIKSLRAIIEYQVNH